MDNFFFQMTNKSTQPNIPTVVLASFTLNKFWQQCPQPLPRQTSLSTWTPLQKRKHPS